MPHELVDEDFRPLVFRSPALDGLRSLVEDPIIRNPMLLVPRALHDSIEARRAWRDHLDREQYGGGAGGIGRSFAASANEHVRLHHDASRLEVHVIWSK